MIDFPNAPTIGQVFIVGGQSWTWDGTKWVPSGNVVMPPLSTGDNRIINGDMRIDQRNNGAIGTAVGYTVDRWQFLASLATKGTWQQIDVGGGLPAFPKCLIWNTSAAYAVTANDYFTFMQRIEADAMSDFQWGTPTAQPVTLSFWAFTNGAGGGQFGGALRNFQDSRCFPFSYTLTTGLWTKIVINIPGDTGTPWTLSGNAASLEVCFGFGCGANLTNPATGAWQTGGAVSANGCVSVVGTNAAQFAVTGVKLEIGSVATPFNRQSLAKSMADCQRYYEVCDAVWTGDGTISNTYTVVVPFAVEKRASPTITSILQTGTSNGNFNARAVQATVAGPQTRAVTWGGTLVSTGPARGFNDSFSASAEL